MRMLADVSQIEVTAKAALASRRRLHSGDFLPYKFLLHDRKRKRSWQSHYADARIMPM